MKIGVCDDEEKIRGIIAGKVKEALPTDDVICFSSGLEVLKSNDRLDILLLDIKMPGMSGMETAEKLRPKDKNVVLIFITGEEQYVYDSFDVEAFHFLVKPFSDEKLKEVLERAKERSLRDGKEKKRYTMITSGGTHIKLCLNDIIYAEVFNSKVIVHTDESDIEYYGKLTDLEKLAGQDFFRTHRAFLVHLKYVVRYDAQTVYLKKGSAIVSKQNYPLFVQAMMKYNSRKGLLA